MQSVVITGISTGIGYGAARALIAVGFRVFGSVRTRSDAERIQSELGSLCVPLIFDVTDHTAIRQAADNVKEQLGGQTLKGLINNAGIAVAGPLLELDIQDYKMQLEVNLIGQLAVTQAFAPLLGIDKALNGPKGRIINISSISGVRAMPFMGAYSSSKFGLEGMSESLRRELMYYGIKVIVVGPGPIKTPIWDKAEQIDTSRYRGSDYLPYLLKFQKESVARGRKGETIEKMNQVILHALNTKKPKTRYQVMKTNLVESLLVRMAPKLLIDKLIAKKLGFPV